MSQRKVAYSPLETEVEEGNNNPNQSKHHRPAPNNPLDQLANGNNSILSCLCPSGGQYLSAENNGRFKKLSCTLLLGALALSFYTTFKNGNGISIYGKSHGSPPSHSSYTILSSDYLQEYNSVLTLYQHKQTLAEMITIIPTTTTSTQEDMAFGISFRTIPSDSTGVAHIMEHSVLCGSAKFPVKDPFVHLQKGSLKTFLNAMTYPDRTVYPIASRNKKDLKNLMEVYLDAVFFPRAVEEEGKWIWRQEGWRYDFEEADEGEDEGEKDLVYKGVVYSEMKGVYSNPDSLLNRYSQHLLFPDNTYQFDSGGDPDDIPNLTHEQFVNFHKVFYHPTNSKSFFYGGKEEAEDALNMVNDYLSHFDVNVEARKQSEIPRQEWTFREPVFQSAPYAVSEDSDGEEGKGQHFVCITWLIDPEPMDVLTELTWVVLDHLLFGEDSSVLHKGLIDTGLGTDIVGGGVGFGLLQSTFAAGMKGVAEQDVAGVINAVLDILGGVAASGFTENDIKSSLNTIEFHLRENDIGSSPKGLELTLNVLNKWNYDEHPIRALVFEDALAELKDIINQSGSAVFQDLIRKYLLGNTHRVVMELFPSTTIGKEQKQTEKDRLAAIKSSLKPKEFKNIVKEVEYLNKIQNTDDSPEAIATIPMLTLADINRDEVEYPIEVVTDAFQTGATLVTHEVESSSGIAYIDFGWDISSISYADVSLLSLFGRLMKEAGTTELTDVELRQKIGMNTGGVSVRTHLQGVVPEGVDQSIVFSGNNFRTLMFIRGKCTSDKSAELFNIIRQILIESNLNAQDKVVNFLKEDLSDLQRDIPSKGHHYAATRIKAHYSPLGFVGEKIGGVTSVDEKKAFLKQAIDDWPSLLARLENMKQIMLSGGRDGMILNLSGDKNVLSVIQDSAVNFLQTQLPAVAKPPPQPLPNFAAVEHPWVASIRADMAQYLSTTDDGIVVPTQVSYICKGGLMYDFDEKVSGSTAVITHYLQSGYLWDTVRVKNGAYGIFALLIRSSGMFLMVSYRDPNYIKTLDAYDGAAESLFQDASTVLKDNGGAELTKAIIGTIGDMDGKAKSARDLGWTSLERWLQGQSADMRQQLRDEVLATSTVDFTEFAMRLQNWRDITTAAVASQSAVDKAAAAGMQLNLVTIG